MSHADPKPEGIPAHLIALANRVDLSKPGSVVNLLTVIGWEMDRQAAELRADFCRLLAEHEAATTPRRRRNKTEIALTKAIDQAVADALHGSERSDQERAS